MSAADWLPAGWRQPLQAARRRCRSAWIRCFSPFGPEDLMRALRSIGVEEGMVLMMHSSFARFDGFTAGAVQAVNVMQQAVTRKGVLMMPTLPFNGAAVEYVLSGAVTDFRRTPSRMGLLTEFFRRRPDVIRSIHPTHPIALWGQRARAAAGDHHKAATPCGRGTPFDFLVRERGSVLLAGVGIGTMTLWHHIEELLEPAMPFSPFTREWYELETLDEEGRAYRTRTRLYDPDVSARRDLTRLVGPLREAGLWRETRAGRLTLILLPAAGVVEIARGMAARGEYCYRPPAP
jgi:aminoglycoside 3-N-acetyltransferase